MAKKGHFRQKRPKKAFLPGIPRKRGFRAFLALPGRSGAGVLHQPLGRRGRPGPWELPGGLPDPVPGVCPDPVPGTRILGSRAPPPQRAPEGSPGGPGQGPGDPRTPREGGFTSTPRAGAPRFPGAVPGPGGPREVRKGPPGGPWPPDPLPGVPETPPRNRGLPLRAHPPRG